MRIPSIIVLEPPSSSVEDDRVEPSLGLLYIASNLSPPFNNRVSLIDLSGARSEQDINISLHKIPEADIYGLHTLCTTYNYVQNIISIIRAKSPSAFIVLGGPHASSLPEAVLSSSGADVVVTGEGEDAFAKLVMLWYEGRPFRGILKGFGRENIDSYNFPNRELVDYSTYHRTLNGKPVVSLLSSRGCKHKCAFCNSTIMGGGGIVRYRSPANVLAEMNFLRDSFSQFRFNDDHFTGNPKLRELLHGITDLDIRYRVFARIEDLTKDICELLMKSGCIHVSVGLESLDAQNLRCLGKGSQAGHERNVRNAVEAGLTIRASFMVGLPYDTDERIERYFKQASLLGLSEYAVYPLIPYPGTQIFEQPQKFGYRIVNDNLSDYIQMGRGGRTVFALEHANFSPCDVERWRGRASQLLEAGGALHMIKSEVAK